MDKKRELFERYQDKLRKSLSHLSYSYEKAKTLSFDIASLDDESLEVWESFAMRFSRASDLFITKYLRLKTLLEDPGFSGTVRDYIQFAEKMGWVEDAKLWLRFRELRNIVVHEYTDQALGQLYREIRDACPCLLAIKV